MLVSNVKPIAPMTDSTKNTVLILVLTLAITGRTPILQLSRASYATLSV